MEGIPKRACSGVFIGKTPIGFESHTTPTGKTLYGRIPSLPVVVALPGVIGVTTGVATPMIWTTVDVPALTLAPTVHTSPEPSTAMADACCWIEVKLVYTGADAVPAMPTTE